MLRDSRNRPAEAPRRACATAALVILTLMIGACGIKGPLKPPPPAAGTTPPTNVVPGPPATPNAPAPAQVPTPPAPPKS